MSRMGNAAVALYSLPFTVTGDLVFERGAWRLTGHITVDSSFLEHRKD